MTTIPQAGAAEPTAPSSVPTLSIQGLTIDITSARRPPQPLVQDVTLDVLPGETMALVGESGSGKSLTALSCLGLLPEPLQLTAGTIEVAGRSIHEMSERDLREIRGSEVSMIFQDPLTSLDPCFTVGSQIVESILAHRSMSRGDARRLAIETLDLVGIPEPSRRFDSFPHEFSGGMRQRAMIAGALVLRPRLLVADEPTTALDVTTQAAILDLVRSLRQELGMSILWISHDLGVVASIADRVAVMYAGELVEVAPAQELFSASSHPYTRGLIASSRLGGPGEAFGFIPGNVPEPHDWSAGCRFAGRCAMRELPCDQPQPWLSMTPVHQHRCGVAESVQVGS